MKRKNNKNKIPVSFRMDEVSYIKLNYIANIEFRDFSAQLNYSLFKFIEQYEKNNELKEDEDYLSLFEEKEKK